jgi:thiol-disulfide isomerase/thioredoxin
MILLLLGEKAGMRAVVKQTSFLFAALILITHISVALADTPAGWSTNFPAALKQAETKQQPVLAYFTASWCGPCKLMARTTLTNESVIETLKGFSYVAVDIDEQHDLAEKYGVRAVPSFHVLTAAGDEVTTTTGYQEAGRFVQWLTNGLSEVRETIARQEKFKQTLASVDELIKKTDAESLRSAATQLLDLAGDREESIQKAATDRLTILAKYEPVLVLEGLNHPRLAARIRVANILKSQLGEGFDVDVWADPATRKKAVGQWRERLAAKK